MHVVDEHEQPREARPLVDDAEFGRLLDRVDGVAAGIGERDDLRLGGLRLQQEGGEVGAGEGVAHGAQTLPPLASTTAAVSRSSAWPNA